jgi:hypothetical protein
MGASFFEKKSDACWGCGGVLRYTYRDIIYGVLRVSVYLNQLVPIILTGVGVPVRLK